MRAGGSSMRLTGPHSGNASLPPPQAPDRPLNEQVDHRGQVALAPNRLADATFRALDELVQVAPVTHVPSEGLDEMHRVWHELRAFPHGRDAAWGDKPGHALVGDNSVDPSTGAPSPATLVSSMLRRRKGAPREKLFRPGAARGHNPHHKSNEPCPQPTWPEHVLQSCACSSNAPAAVRMLCRAG